MFRKLITAMAATAALVAPLGASAYELYGTKWGAPTLGTAASVTWSFVTTDIDCSSESGIATCVPLSTFMPTGYETEIQDAFNAWSAVSGLTFTQVIDDGKAAGDSTTAAQIRLSGHSFDGDSGVLAHAYYPSTHPLGGDMHFDTAENWVTTFAGSGIDIYQVTAHELGHSLGLSHTSVANSLMNPTYSEAFTGPQADDIAGIQALYGMPTAVPEPTGKAAI